jgi:hypothetical protein
MLLKKLIITAGLAGTLGAAAPAFADHIQPACDRDNEHVQYGQYGAPANNYYGYDQTTPYYIDQDDWRRSEWRRHHGWDRWRARRWYWQHHRRYYWPNY